MQPFPFYLRSPCCSSPLLFDGVSSPCVFPLLAAVFFPPSFKLIFVLTRSPLFEGLASMYALFNFSFLFPTAIRFLYLFRTLHGFSFPFPKKESSFPALRASLFSPSLGFRLRLIRVLVSSPLFFPISLSPVQNVVVFLGENGVPLPPMDHVSL